QQLGALDAPLNVILMRWNSKRSLECSTEMMLAQADKPSERGERNLFAHVLFNITADGAHLPGGKPAAIRVRSASEALAGSRKFVHQHLGECCQVESVSRLAALDRAP